MAHRRINATGSRLSSATSTDLARFAAILQSNPADTEAILRVGCLLAQRGAAILARAFLAAGLDGSAGHLVARLKSELHSVRTQDDMLPSENAHPPNLQAAIDFRASGAYHAAIAALHDQLSRNPRNAEVLGELAHTCLLAGKPDAARVYLQIASELGEKGPSIKKNHARLCLLEKDAKTALQLVEHLLQSDPDDAESLALQGLCLRALGDRPGASECFDHALARAPDYAEAFLHRGLLARQVGDVDRAQDDLERAFALKPHLKDGWTALIELKSRTGGPATLLPMLEQMARIDPSNTSVALSLSQLRLETGDVAEALKDILRVLEHDRENARGFVMLATLLRCVRFSRPIPRLERTALRMLERGTHVSLKEIALPVMSLVRQNPDLALLCADPPLTLKTLAETERAVSVYASSPLLLRLLALTPIPDRILEIALTRLRAAVLYHLDQLDDTDALLTVLQVLAQHCFVNEYVFSRGPDEDVALVALDAVVTAALEKGQSPATRQVLCLATYKPLAEYHWCQDLKPQPALEPVAVQQVRHPRIEEQLKRTIPCLSIINDPVSNHVRDQYEENPYPRWVIPERYPRAQTLAEIAQQARLRLSSPIPATTSPEILIAGCGTGQHALAAASRYAGGRLLAVDLSLASLAYASRKSADLGVSNVDYLHADILALPALDRSFDVIETIGVLHHMADPLEGWRILRDRLRPGGLMRIGLYSQKARIHVNSVRDEIAQKGIGSTPAEMRSLRDEIGASATPAASWLRSVADFYALSETRDLLFHVQEHQFTLPEIAASLDGLGLCFCGFEGVDLTRDFARFHVSGASLYDLGQWHEYEEANPGAFAGMYQFWCQKP